MLRRSCPAITCLLVSAYRAFSCPESCSTASLPAPPPNQARLGQRCRVLSAGAVASFPAAAQYRSVRCRARFVSGLGFSQAAIRPPTSPARERRRMQMSFAFAEGAAAFPGCGKTPWARSFVSGREFTRAASREKSVWGFSPCGMFSHRQPQIRPFSAACAGP